MSLARTMRRVASAAAVAAVGCGLYYRTGAPSSAFLSLSTKATFATCEPAGNSDPAHEQNLQGWADRWAAKRTGWHQQEPHPLLVKYAKESLLSSKTILVPLCGKTVDLGWLGQQNGVENVVGVDCVEQAAVELAENPGPIVGFQEIPALKTTAFGGWGGAVVRDAAVSIISFIVGDFFMLQPANFNDNKQVEAVWDRAAMVAIDPSMREKYVETIDRCLQPGGRILLVTFEYDQDKVSGPPHSIPEAEVRRLYTEDKWDVKLLSHEPFIMDNPRFTEIKNDVVENAFLIRKKK
eukprot:m.978382 g.978382  ORF g.978382 m.978382 type:complete len:294 (-) comp23956_c1_seq20:1827-2708(-)